MSARTVARDDGGLIVLREVPSVDVEVFEVPAWVTDAIRRPAAPARRYDELLDDGRVRRALELLLHEPRDWAAIDEALAYRLNRNGATVRDLLEHGTAVLEPAWRPPS